MENYDTACTGNGSRPYVGNDNDVGNDNELHAGIKKVHEQYRGCGDLRLRISTECVLFHCRLSLCEKER